MIIGKTVRYGCGQCLIMGFCKTETIQKKGEKLTYILLLQCREKQIEKLLVLRENQWSPLLHNFQQILVILMPLTLVLPLEQATMPEIAPHL